MGARNTLLQAETPCQSSTHGSATQREAQRPHLVPPSAARPAAMVNSSAAPTQVQSQGIIHASRAKELALRRTVVLVGLLDVRLQLGAQRRFSHIFARNGRDEVFLLGSAARAAGRRLQQPLPLGRRVIALRNLCEHGEHGASDVGDVPRQRLLARLAGLGQLCVQRGGLRSEPHVHGARAGCACLALGQLLRQLVGALLQRLLDLRHERRKVKGVSAVLRHMASGPCLVGQLLHVFRDVLLAGAAEGHAR